MAGLALKKSLLEMQAAQMYLLGPRTQCSTEKDLVSAFLDL